MLTFTVFQGSSIPPSGLSPLAPGVIPTYEVSVNVQFTDVDGWSRPDAGALVKVGLHEAWTDASGWVKLSLPAGRYSAYVKSEDSRLLPLTMELVVDRNMTLQVEFKLLKLSPKEVELESGAGSTRVKMTFEAPDGRRMFISYPQLTGLTSTGLHVRVARGVDGVSNFFQRVEGGVLVLELDVVEGELVMIYPDSTFLPLQIIDWKVSP